MKNKIVFPLLITTFLSSGYPTIKVVQANPPLQIAQSIWKQFSSSEGGFRLLMPGTPTQENKSVNTQVGALTIHMFIVPRQKEAIYAVAYADLPSNISPTPSEINQLLTDVAYGISDGAGGRLLSQQAISLGNFPGKEIRLQLAEGMIARGRIYLVNKRLYQVLVATNQERNLTKSIEGFLNSFQLLNNSPPSPNLPPEDLNTEIKEALCSQNWPQALKLINQMIAVTPNSEVRSQLMTYQRQLQDFANSRRRLPAESLPNCSSGR